MEPYTEFATVYDTFMDNIDYDMWCGYLKNLLECYGISPNKGRMDLKKKVLDLGCGTGNVTTRMRDFGYNMIGVDLSPDMLSVAKDKDKKGNILYINQDMRNLEIFGTVSAVVSLCDCVNYITDMDDLKKVFIGVYACLDPGGVFIFDLKTKSYFEKIGDSVIAEDREECSFIWENSFDEKSCINEYDLSLFIKAKDGRYDKYNEIHRQRAYRIEVVKQVVKSAGFDFEAAYTAFTKQRAREYDNRVYIIAKKSGKPPEE